MSTLPTELRNKLERTAIAARNLAEKAAKAALESLAVQSHDAYGHMTKEQKDLRNKLRAHARQLGDTQDAKGQLSIKHLAQECAYEHWHRMLFARFLAENNLLIEPEMRMPISLNECKELAEAEKTNVWALAGRYAQTMLPEIFRADDPVLQVPLAKEDQLKLEQLLDVLPADVFTASDSLGWYYQFWQTQQKETVNKSGTKIGADELPAVTQLFTEDYMVDFLLDNTLGAWHAGKILAANPKLAESAKTEDELRKAVALPGVPWKYLRFIKHKVGKWTPASDVFDDWPKSAKELKCLDPCMGSGHFVVAMFERLVALRVAEEKLDESAAVAAVIRENLFGLEIDPRCTQIGAFNLALAAWRRVGHRPLPGMNLACSGLAPNAKKDDWTKLAESNANLRFPMGALYDLFQKARVLGSLINPRRDKAVTYLTTLQELQPLLDAAIKREARDDTVHELAVTAQGIAKAAEILAGQFTLVATNVPYLGREGHTEDLTKFADGYAPDAAADLATLMLHRCLQFTGKTGTVSVVLPQNWWVGKSYSSFRNRVLVETTWRFAAVLGEEAWRAFGNRGPNTILLLVEAAEASHGHKFSALDVSTKPGTPVVGLETKVGALAGQQETEDLQRLSKLIEIGQQQLCRNREARISVAQLGSAAPLSAAVISGEGCSTGDNDHFLRCFWELSQFAGWMRYCGPGFEHWTYCDNSLVVLWEDGEGELSKSDQARIQNIELWQQRGVLVGRVRGITATLFFGGCFSKGAVLVCPRDKSNHLPIYAFLSSKEYEDLVRTIDPRVSAATSVLTDVPFDLDYWQKVAGEKYPHGLPKPFSSDPTQWLFNGHPKGSDHPLHVAVARLLGYQWPRQTGSSFPDCPALGADGLEKFADADGIVCIPSVRGKEPAAERVQKLLAVAYGADWKTNSELELIRATGSDAGDLEEWLRNDFFEQHCDLFHQRPFLWHIWDGRKRDGFQALVNYHALAGEKGKGRRTLESLTHSYLGDWITRQKDSLKRREEGAEERLAAALALKERLEAIIDGEPPYDIFVRWKPLDQQAIGWEPDINDGVRMNIRPFLVSDLPNGKKGTGVLRSRPNIKWDKDRGNEPQRSKEDFPWFWKDGEFTGDRVNAVHLTNDLKRKARS